LKRVVHRLNEALTALLRDNPNLFVIGEDLLDPYGGAFKVTKGLSSAFPERVLSTPISEAGFVGVGAGLALRGYEAVVEIMFGDFVTLIADQLINQISKMTWMYGEPLPLRLVVRTPMGGRRGYGPTHSQTLERLYLGVPGLSVVAVSHLFDPGEMLRRAVVDTAQPVLFIENKTLYTEPVLAPDALYRRSGLRVAADEALFPTLTLSPDEAPDVTLVSYGGMVPLCLDAAQRLREEEELAVEVVVPHLLSPLDAEPLLASARRSRRVVVVEEGIAAWGWGAEVVAELAAVALGAPPERVGAKGTPIPASRELETHTLPQTEDIIAAVLRTVDRTFQ
jgi:pyruvate/2-oxoglutarate/acetoin dehydrogenase E1 component